MLFGPVDVLPFFTNPVQVISETTHALKLTTKKNIDKENSLLEESLGCQTDVKKKLEDFEMLKVLGKGTFGKVCVLKINLYLCLFKMP